MVLEIYKTDDGHVPGIEYLPTTEDAPGAGTVLEMLGGGLQNTGFAEYISMAKEAKDGILPVVRMDGDTVYKGRIAPGSEADMQIGQEVTLGETGFEADDVGRFTTVGILEDGILVRLV